MVLVERVTVGMPNVAPTGMDHHQVEKVVAATIVALDQMDHHVDLNAVPGLREHCQMAGIPAMDVQAVVVRTVHLPEAMIAPAAMLQSSPLKPTSLS